jgi:hypothetical protein
VVPVEVGERLIEALPVVADKVPSAAARVRREIVLARFLGKLAVDQGIREVRSRLAPDIDPDADAVADAAPAEAPAAVTVDLADEASNAVVVESPPSKFDTPAVDELALADYDHLSSAQVVSKLTGLDGGELDAIEAYERAGRHRRTILGKIEQVRAAEVSS